MSVQVLEARAFTRYVASTPHVDQDTRELMQTANYYGVPSCIHHIQPELPGLPYALVVCKQSRVEAVKACNEGTAIVYPILNNQLFCIIVYSNKSNSSTSSQHQWDGYYTHDSGGSS